MVTLRFSAGTGPAAMLVRAVTWSWCAHVGFKLKDGTVLDATPEYGVSIREAADDETTIYFKVNVPQERVMEHALTQVGKPYDFIGALGVGLHRDWREQDHWFCSEFVAWSLEKAGYPLLRTNHINRITPQNLLLSPRLIPVHK